MKKLFLYFSPKEYNLVLDNDSQRDKFTPKCASHIILKCVPYTSVKLFHNYFQ